MLKENETLNSSLITLIRIAVYGHIIGYLWRGISIAIEDIPDIFSRVDIGSFVWPIVILILFYLAKADQRLALILSPGITVIFAAIVSISMFLISISDIVFSWNIPKYLASSSWQYWQVVSVVTFLMYLIILILTVIYSIRALREAPKQA